MRSFFFKFIDEDEDEDEVELLVLLGDKDVDPSTLFNLDFIGLIQSGQPVSPNMKSEFHRMLSTLDPHTQIPPLPYWLKAHQLILDPNDTIHRDRLEPSLWKKQTVTILLDLGDAFGRSEETKELLDYAPVIDSNYNNDIVDNKIMHALCHIGGQYFMWQKSRRPNARACRHATSKGQASELRKQARPC